MSECVWVSGSIGFRMPHMAVRAVTTTGIYCRAGCTARPAAHNVRRLRNAMEAQAAGFRPCLLCRPDRLPGFGIEQPAAEDLLQPEVAEDILPVRGISIGD